MPPISVLLTNKDLLSVSPPSFPLIILERKLFLALVHKATFMPFFIKEIEIEEDSKTQLQESKRRQYKG
ncbi:hypothetical protein A946_11115 [Methylacidiphilum kamchatkense Kam1]|uniref:Uncharacterized protein n=1 Tax=Methylacidiphilum kamchatkense Kam1 TaxID=1202785 RepID=A0ABR4ZUC5_9BACT|nr:hypothetical protein A946_11115 [Methylacidiphilum kamchatkense Kam1]